MEDYDTAQAIRRATRLVRDSERGFGFSVINIMFIILVVALIFAPFMGD